MSSGSAGEGPPSNEAAPPDEETTQGGDAPGPIGGRERGRKKRFGYLGLSLLSGLLLATPFLFAGLWWIHYVALVPWAFMLTRPGARAAWLYFLAGAYVFLAVSFAPFSLFHPGVPIVAAGFYVLLYVPFAILLRRIHLRFHLPLALLVPVVWVAMEWFRTRYSLGEVALYQLGTSQFNRLALIQIADLAGVYGVSFLVAAVNGALADLWIHGRRRNWRALWTAALVPGLLAAALVYGVPRARDAEFEAGPRVAIVQPDETHYRDPQTVLPTFRKQLDFTRTEIAPGSADVIVLPENAVGLPFGDDPRYLEETAALGEELGGRVILGAVTRAGGIPPRIFTSAYYVSPDHQILARYDKLHLIPWGEYVPFESALSRVSPALNRAHYRLARQLLGYAALGRAGEELVLFEIESGGRVYRTAVPICFEVTSGGFGRDAVASGAHFLLNITSEGVFGPAVYWHMLAHSTFRAVETRIAVVRVGNHGISGFIAPNGSARLLRGNETGRPYLEAGTLVGAVPLSPRGGETLYLRWGDWLAYLCAGAAALAFACALLSRRRPSASSAPGRLSRPNP